MNNDNDDGGIKFIFFIQIYLNGSNPLWRKYFQKTCGGVWRRFRQINPSIKIKNRHQGKVFLTHFQIQSKV